MYSGVLYISLGEVSNTKKEGLLPSFVYYKITFVDGREIIVENLMDYARETDYHYTGLYNVKLGYTKRCKDIIKVERVDLT